MSQELWNNVDRYFNDLLCPSDLALDAALSASDAAGLPTHQVAPNQGKLLQILALAVRARRILEIGTLGGYSSIWLARALPPEGALVTLESNAHHAEVARANIARAALPCTVDLRLGPALDSLAALHAEGAEAFDLVFIDADKPNNAAYLAWALKLSRPGTMIMADNVVRAGAVSDASSQDANVRGVRSFCEMMAREPRLNATALQTVGCKGYDGFALALVVS